MHRPINTRPACIIYQKYAFNVCWMLYTYLSFFFKLMHTTVYLLMPFRKIEEYGICSWQVQIDFVICFSADVDDVLWHCSLQTTNWIQNYLSERTQIVVVDGYPSSPCDVTSGVPQGSVTGPLLFTVFINDPPDSIKSTARLFADDTVVYNTVEYREHLQKDLHTLEEWEKTWKMEFNALKCEHAKFSRKRQRGIVNDYQLHQICLPKTTGVK